jgi:hypothetical protein
MDQQITTLRKKSAGLAFKAGIAYALYYTLSAVIFEMIGMDNRYLEPTIGKRILTLVLTYTPLTLAVVYVQTAYKKELGNYITFGNAFRAGFKVAAYAGFFVMVLIILHNTILNTQGYHDSIAAMEAANPNKQNGTTMDSLSPHLALAFVWAFTPGFIYFLIGSMVSLVSAAIIKRVRPFAAEA